MITKQLQEYHKGQPVVINIEYVDRVYATLVDFTEDTIIVKYSKNSKTTYDHSYDEVTLDYFCIDYTAPDKEEYMNKHNEEFRASTEANTTRVQRRLDAMFGKEVKPKKRTPRKKKNPQDKKPKNAKAPLNEKQEEALEKIKGLLASGVNSRDDGALCVYTQSTPKNKKTPVVSSLVSLLTIKALANRGYIIMDKKEDENTVQIFVNLL